MDGIRVPIPTCNLNSLGNEVRARNKLTSVSSTAKDIHCRQLKANTSTPKKYSSLINASHCIASTSKPKLNLRINQSFSSLLRPNTSAYHLQSRAKGNIGMFKISSTVINEASLIGNTPWQGSASTKHRSVNFVQDLKNSLKKVSSRLNISYESRQSVKKRYNNWLMKRKIVNTNPRPLLRLSLFKTPSKPKQRLTFIAETKSEAKAKSKIYIGTEHSHPEVTPLLNTFSTKQRKTMHKFIEDYSKEYRGDVELSALMKVAFNAPLNCCSAFVFGKVY